MVHHTYPESFIIVCIITKVLFSLTSKTLMLQFLHEQIKILCLCDFLFSNFPYIDDKTLKILFYRAQHQCMWKIKTNEVEFILVSNAKQHEGPYSTFPSIVLTVGCIHTHHNFNGYLVLTRAMAETLIWKHMAIIQFQMFNKASTCKFVLCCMLCSDYFGSK